MNASRDSKCEERQFSEWKAKVIEACKTGISRRKDGKFGLGLQGKREFSNEARQALRTMQQSFVFVPADKAANNITVICRQYYQHVLRTELTRDGGAYTGVAAGVTEETLIKQHVTELKSMHLFPTKLAKSHGNLPYLYWLPKLHKNPAGARFIAGSASCSTTLLSVVLSSALNLVAGALRDKSDTHMKSTGVRRFWVLDGYEECSSFLHNWHRPVGDTDNRELHSGDFSTMYTTIPHDDLHTRITKCIQEAFDYVREKHSDQLKDGERLILGVYTDEDAMKVTKTEWDTLKQTHRALVHSQSYHPFTVESLSNAVRMLLNNIYMNNAGTVRRQKLGIPMGTNCAPILANLYLYSYEVEFLDGLELINELEIARRFHASFRYIDDALSVDNEYWTTFAAKCYEDGGIYPRALVLNDTTLTPEADAVNYVGMEIRNRPPEPFTYTQRKQHEEKIELGNKLDRVYMNVFDKRKEFPFSVRRYPDMSSLIPESVPYGVFIGQLHRYYKICTEWRDFNQNSLDLGGKLLEKGCTVAKLTRAYRAFLSRMHNEASNRTNATNPTNDTNRTNHRLFKANSLQKIVWRYQRALAAIQRSLAFEHHFGK